MKVLALVVLVIAVSGLEAGVVKRDAEEPFRDITNFFQNIGKSFQEKFTNGEIPAQAQELGSQIQNQAATFGAHIQKWVEELTALAKQKI